MSAGRYTSRVFVAMEAIYAKLDALTFAAHPVTGDVPVVQFGDEDPGGANEYISVSLNVDQSSIQWRRLSPPGADEQMFVEVIFRSLVPCGYTSAELFNRLQAISDQIQGAFYDHTTETITDLGYTGEVGATLVTAVQPDCFPTTEGWFGSVRHVIDTSAQI